MKRFARTCHLKNEPAALAMYVDEHTRVFPEVMRALREVGVLEMRIWLVGNRLFMLCECEDSFEPARDWPRYHALHPRVAEWEAKMGALFVPPPESTGGLWLEMPEVFCLSEQLARLDSRAT